MAMARIGRCSHAVSSQEPWVTDPPLGRLPRSEMAKPVDDGQRWNPRRKTPVLFIAPQKRAGLALDLSKGCASWPELCTNPCKHGGRMRASCHPSPQRWPFAKNVIHICTPGPKRCHGRDVSDAFTEYSDFQPLGFQNNFQTV
jgi:hypothetical protein